MAENSENSQELPDNSENLQELAVVKRGRGRPKGSLDSAPRKRKIVEEPPEEPAPPVAAPKPAPAKPVAPTEPVRQKTRPPAARAKEPVEAEAPPSPRTLFRQAGETIFALQSQRENARKDFWAQQIHKSLR